MKYMCFFLEPALFTSMFASLHPSFLRSRSLQRCYISCQRLPVRGRALKCQQESLSPRLSTCTRVWEDANNPLLKRQLYSTASGQKHSAIYPRWPSKSSLCWSSSCTELWTRSEVSAWKSCQQNIPTWEQTFGHHYCRKHWPQIPGVHHWQPGTQQ